ncbi:hypothetical protein FB382_003446 [Nocardioides ginsengisegetis]|uniref:Uncharacterized protein n=1 Tax=Nocardioides ginsengisegetis TaxID=661491 RepID=A0A7W3PAW1_9ACTN|nr:hypothetical protein [Nocardioides ginsengisegetis]MBA8805155.1 hypothetical protein [Nocardioides ginsengisegetis]
MLKFLIVVILIAIAVYMTTRVIQRRGIMPPAPRAPRTPPRPFGPDDDPDFLRDLDRRRKHPEDPDA